MKKSFCIITVAILLLSTVFASVSYAALPGDVNGDRVTEIGKGAFSSCGELTDVMLGGDVVIIGKEAFRYCVKLADIIYGGTSITWNDMAFRSDWNKDTGDYAVRCVDKDIIK